VPERSWVQKVVGSIPASMVEPGISTFGDMLVLVLQLISPVCKIGTSLEGRVLVESIQDDTELTNLCTRPVGGEVQDN
jgi:hypothetical protein